MPAMVVSITNITDAPKSKHAPVRLAIYTALLDPGDELKLPASMVDARLRKMETDGYIAIGQLPSWYEASKARRQGHALPVSTEEMAKRLSSKKEEAPQPKGEMIVQGKKPRIKLDELAKAKEDTEAKK